MSKVVRNNHRAAQQINGREGETATFLKRNLVSFSLRVFGFAPRHLNRYAASPCDVKSGVITFRRKR